MLSVIAHAGLPPQPHDLWSSWNLDPALLGLAAAAGWAYWRGRTPGQRRRQDVWRGRCFVAALVVVAVALVSPLDALSSALASAHMVQHVLLIVVAAPLFALSAPGSVVYRGTPVRVRRAGTRWRRRLGVRPAHLRWLRNPVVVGFAYVATLWLWHAAVLYDAAVEHHAVHVLEHGTFLLTGVLFWRTIVDGRGSARVSPPAAVLLLFAAGMQSVALSLLLTFATTPWYEAYADTTSAWGLPPLRDQQLAGAIMWVPAGIVYVGAALVLLMAWLRRMERADGEERFAVVLGGESRGNDGHPLVQERRHLLR